MTNQEAFDKVWNWFVRDGNPRAMEGRQCKYRTATGARCAAGVLIPDELYDPGMEDITIGTLLDGWGFWSIPCQLTDYDLSRLREHFVGVNINLLLNLQSAHDKAPNLPEALREIAGRYDLTVPA